MAKMNSLPSITQEGASHFIPEVRTVNIKLQSIGTSIELIYPSFGSETRFPAGEAYEQLESNANDLSNFALNHQEFRKSLSQGKNCNRNFLQLAKAEIETVYSLFPTVSASRIQICMAAWLAALCDIDDLIESICAKDAAAAVSRAISSLEDEGVTPADSTWPPQTYNAVRITNLLQAHCRKHLSTHEAKDFFTTVAGALKGLAEEQNFRQGLLAEDFGQYMRIRAYTIGIFPSLSLLRSEFRPQGDLNKLLAIQVYLNILLGLQNDLLGLEKDLQSGENMNAVIVLMKTMGKGSQKVPPITVLQAVPQAVAYYNNTFYHLLELLQSIFHAENGLDIAGKFVANAQLRLAETHLQWCLTAKRYQVSLS